MGKKTAKKRVAGKRGKESQTLGQTRKRSDNELKVKQNKTIRKGTKQKTMDTNNKFEYYLIGSDYKPTTPLLRDDEDEDEDTWFLVGSKPLYEKDIRTFKLCFNSPIPKKVVMTDYHSLPNSVFSRKIFDVLNGLKIFGIQLLPTEIKHNKTKEVYSDYWIIYIYNKIQCLDMKNAEYELDKSDGNIRNITKLILDNEILSNIPLEKRLIFSLHEDCSKYIYHKSVVEAIMATNPEGVQFTPVEK